MPDDKKKIRTQRGIALTQLLIGGLLAAGLLFSVAIVLDKTVSPQQKIFSKGASRLEMIGLMNNITKVGRLATHCNRLKVQSNTALDCTIDFNVPPTPQNTADDTTVRFLYDNDCDGKGPCIIFSRGESVIKYRNIESFIVCDDTMMAKKNNKSCPMEDDRPGEPTDPGHISQAHGLNLDNNYTQSDRFFRFRVTTTDPNYQGATITYQSAFYARNDLTDFPNVAYQWGSQH